MSAAELSAEAVDTASPPLVGVVMGSRSDWDRTMAFAAETLTELGVPHEVRVVSAHRTPDLLFLMLVRQNHEGCVRSLLELVVQLIFLACLQLKRGFLSSVSLLRQRCCKASIATFNCSDARWGSRCNLRHRQTWCYQRGVICRCNDCPTIPRGSGCISQPSSSFRT